ncbi:MAG TPA: tRNA (adenosine(37)-N6)-threonylcarbamoyltransferase complex ATPase subunit type 1 TsaE [Candidatus Saccharimonadales bacterium]|nr:tRNA (adenosine(37)-N6)-threonylcarbamoyltransferase complex ATPase subunit type 1 TsaE [Candidatus Saccharimonadales bacterium]
MKTVRYNMQDIDNVATQFAKDIGKVKVITFTGSLGAGKTTFVGALLKSWGVDTPVASPTFAYLNIYELADGRTAYHFDLYRLKNMQEFERAGFSEYLYQPNSVALIEWPEIIKSVLTHSVCRVELQITGQDERIMTYDIKDSS